MRILLSSDWQSQNSNLNLVEQAIEKELEILDKYDIDIHIDLGDSKEEYSPVAVSVVNAQHKRAKKLAKRLGKENCFRLNGNHDRIGQHSDSRNWLPIFKDHAVCIDKPYIIKKSGIDLAFLPFNKDQDDLVRQAKKLAKKLSGRALLFFHNDVCGARYSNVRKATSESKFTVDAMWHASYVQCFGGHIHKRQTLADNVHYVGNPFPTDMGEINQSKGFIVYNTDTDIIKFIPSGLPGIFTLDYLLKKNVKTVPDGTQIKYTVKVKPEDDYYEILGNANEEITKRYPNSIPYVLPDFVENIKKIEENINIAIDATELEQIKGYLDIVDKEGQYRLAVESYMRYVLSTISRKAGYAKGLAIESIKAHNILSFKDVKFDYRNKEICLIRGINKDWPGHSNGSGKSNLISLLPIAISGKTFKEQKYTEIVNDYTPDEKASVSLNCTSASGDKFEIYRQFNPSKLRFTVNGKDASQGMRSSGKRDTQGLIEEFLGYNFDTLANAIYIDQSMSQTFLYGTDKDRADLLHKFQNLDRFVLAQKIVSKHQSTMKALVNETEIATDMQEMLLQETKERIQDLEQIKASHLRNLKDQLETAKNNYEQYRLKESPILDAIEKKLKIYNSQISKGEVEVKRTKQKYELATTSWKWQKKLLKKAVDTLERPQCDKCLQKIPHNHKKVIVAQYKEKIAALKIKVDITEASVKQKEHIIQDLEDKVLVLEHRREKYANELTKLKARVDIARDKYNEERKTSEGESVGVLKRKLKVIKNKISMLNKLRDEQLSTIIVLSKAFTAFGRDGLPLFLNKLVCPQLNAASQYYSDLFVDGEIQVLFVVENNKLVPRIVNAHGGKKLSGQSLGEKGWAGIICAFAVRDIAQPTNLLILDEPGLGLDQSSSKQLGSRLSKLVDKFETVLVVTHNPYLEAALVGSNTITVIKSNKISTVQNAFKNL